VKTLNNKKGNIPFPKEKYQKLMAENLAMLRTKLNLTQEEIAELIGGSRQTISLLERGVRPMMWDTFICLLFVFQNNDATRPMLPVLGLYTPELINYMNITDLKKLK
jgi:transcriptional regulator with XRE-family HTH domain